ncbi:ATP-binding protein [Phascolarctobacterium sp.]|uniref:ATP-binding protein n=1 Tax=Phascolarctobacterium sp. TaxID=2049039 RepID=UPI00303E0775
MGTIFIAGIYGVGKSTLCACLSKKMGIAAFSAGDLISSVNGEQYGVNKTVTDKNSNQDILISEVHRLLKSNSTILLAGHFCILDNNNNIDFLPRSVFSSLNIEKILLLEANIVKIMANLYCRDRKVYMQEKVSILQKSEREMAQDVSKKLGCDLYVHEMSFNNDDILRCFSYIKGGNQR